MTSRPHKYIPCLRWKQGEYQAIFKLSSWAHKAIMPIIEVSEFGDDVEYDYEEKKPPKTLDEHLSKFAYRVKEKWGTDECFIDLHHIPLSQMLADGTSPSEFIFNDLKAKGIQFTPTIRFQEESHHEAFLHKYVKKENRGLCLRVNLDEFSEDDFEITAKNLLDNYGLSFGNCELILDLEEIQYDQMEEFSNFLTFLIKSKSRLKRWLTFGIIGTSFPQTLAGVKEGISFLPRKEWTLYKLLSTNLQEQGARIPIFGDYTINNPVVIKMDMRIVKPKANIRYTIDDKWLIVRGLNIRDHKMRQLKQLCQSILSSGFYDSPQFSYGDDYIYQCAQGTEGTGNPTTWRKVGTNHHIEKVVQDVANLDVS